ncbi:unnamed protein product [Cuscuta europaea]|uniref:GDT1 family protein n=1 Tax=Cuscuta europaea TaxID=41803 RepID=A0A9P0ZNM0_CUSEU|nr:unnamed protein product [Cuscuta europaea]
MMASYFPIQNPCFKYFGFLDFRFNNVSSRSCNSLLMPGYSWRRFESKYDGWCETFFLMGGMTNKSNCCCTARLPLDGEDSNLARKLALFNRPRENETDSSCEGLDIRLDNYLRFVSMSGLLTLLGAQEAIAASDIAMKLPVTSIFGFFGDLGDISTCFASAFLLIFFSELGDKTFFIAALLAARNSPVVTFFGTFGALAVMTIISAVIGRTFHYVDGILPFRLGGTELPIDDIAAVILLLYFGVSTLLDASRDGVKAEEQEAELAVSELSGNGAEISAAATSAVISTFVLVFVAEWGDKSFFSTIALAAASSPLGVIAGSLAGHGVATLLAVLGGSLLGTFLSEKVIAYIGGTLFLLFAVVTLAEIVK